MKNINTIVCASIIAFATSMTMTTANANHHPNNHGHKEVVQDNKTNKNIQVSVQGMVCDFCARGIEKMFNKDTAVQTVKVDLAAKSVSITLKEGQTLSDAQIKKVIEANGINLVEIKR